MTNLPFTYLAHLSKEIATGRALHALAVANEYLAPAHPLRRALLQKALRQNPKLAATETFGKLSEGARFNDLDKAAQITVQTERAPRLALERRRFSFNGQLRRIELGTLAERRGEPTSRTRRTAVTELVKTRKFATN